MRGQLQRLGEVGASGEALWVPQQRWTLRAVALFCWAPFLGAVAAGAVVPERLSSGRGDMLVVLLSFGLVVPLLLMRQPHYAAFCASVSAYYASSNYPLQVWRDAACWLLLPLLAVVILEIIGWRSVKRMRSAVGPTLPVAAAAGSGVEYAWVMYWVLVLLLFVLLTKHLAIFGWRSSIRGTVMLGSAAMALVLTLFDVAGFGVSFGVMLLWCVNLPLVLIPVTLVLYQRVGPARVTYGSGGDACF